MDNLDLSRPLVLLSSGYVYLDDPKSLHISGDLDTLVGALCRTFRYPGQAQRPYCVLAHSLFCVDVAKKLKHDDLELACLIHDLAEGIIGDCIRGLKSLISEIKTVEQALLEVILRRFNLVFDPRLLETPDFRQVHRIVDTVEIERLITGEAAEACVQRLRREFPEVRWLELKELLEGYLSISDSYWDSRVAEVTERIKALAKPPKRCCGRRTL